ncbi:MAG TPA: hypothetical protein VIG25_16045 [Pyrinomonadaceae bacterium]|jgi:hypothetical protein
MINTTAEVISIGASGQTTIGTHEVDTWRDISDGLERSLGGNGIRDCLNGFLPSHLS